MIEILFSIFVILIIILLIGASNDNSSRILPIHPLVKEILESIEKEPHKWKKELVVYLVREDGLKLAFYTRDVVRIIQPTGIELYEYEIILLNSAYKKWKRKNR